MASPLSKIMGMNKGYPSPQGGFTLPRGKKPKILKILRRASFHNKKKNSTQIPSAEHDDQQDTLRRPNSRKSQQARDLEELERLQKELSSAGLYFCLILKKSMDIIIAKIPDNTAIVLDSVISIDDLLTSCMKVQKVNKDLIPYRKDVHKCMADLARWTDQLLVRGNVKGDLKEGVEHMHDLERSVRELVDVTILKLRKSEVQEEIRNSIFLFEGSTESILVGAENGDEFQVWNKRDSGISEDSGTCDIRDSPPLRSPVLHTVRDSGRGSYNCILDTNNGHMGQGDGTFHTSDKFLSPRRAQRGTLSSRASKDSELSSFSGDSIVFKSPVVSPSGSQEFARTPFHSARSSLEGSFFSVDDLDNHSDHDVIPATFVGVVENHYDPPQLQKKTRSFQVYIELLEGYNKPSEDILRRPTSAFDGYEETFRRSLSHSASSSAIHSLSQRGHHLAPAQHNHHGPGENHAFSSPYLPLPSPTRETQIDWNQNSRSQEMPKKKLLSLVEEGGSRKASNTSASSSSISSTDEDESTPALDCLDVSRFLVYRDDGQGNMLIGGAIDALIVYAAGASKNDLIFYEAFLTTYRTFISPKDLINKLLYRERRFRERGHKKASQNAFFLLLRVIDELNGKVERSILEQLMKEVYRLLINGDLCIGKILRSKMLPKCDNYYNRVRSTSGPAATQFPSTKNDCTILDFHAQDLAQQLTIIDAANFGAIEIPEILAWGKEQSEANSPNLAVFTDHFNKVSYWARSYILSFDKPQDREKIYVKFMKIMKHLRQLNNFNSFLAILSAMDCSAVRRLDWPKHYLDQLAEYTDLIDSSSSFRAYRTALAEATPPCIPYLGLILQDVTFVCLGNVDELPDGKVNFVKRWQLFNILDTVRRFKLMEYDFEVKDDIRQFFGGFSNFLNEDDLFERSLKLKPRSG